MKKIVRVLLVAVLCLAPVTLTAQCLSQYNAALIECDRYFCPQGVFTCMGCKADANADYWDCVVERTVDVFTG